MTRFSIELEECYEMVMWTLKNTLGGEIVIPKLKSYKITDLAKAVDQNCKIKIIGMRPSEKIHEELINEKEAEILLNFKKYYIIITKSIFELYKKSNLKFKIINSINYNSKENKSYLNIIELKKMIQNLKKI